MSQAIRKKLIISLEYTDHMEAELALEMVLKDRLKGVKYQRVMYSTSICEWSCTEVHEMDYREEVINGQLCQVYESKLNK